jgi:hypothetical protein
MQTEPLVTYLNDHIGGSRSALQLLDHLVDNAGDEPATREFLTSLRADIAADRETLEQLIHRVGGRPSAVRDVGGWIAEKVARLKLAVEDPGGEGLKWLESFEILALGILGKRALWRALIVVAPQTLELRDFDLPGLEQRAEEQYARVEARRLEAARRALLRHEQPR